jgi:hypothetical protein
MGPSDDKYNNQHWFPVNYPAKGNLNYIANFPQEGNSGLYRISNLGLLNNTLISRQLDDNSYVSLMQNTADTTIDDSAQDWKLVKDSLVAASDASTIAATSPAIASPTPTASSPATLSTPNTATASYLSSSIATTTAQSTNPVATSTTQSTYFASTTSSPPSSTPNPGVSSGSGLNTDSIVGIVFGIIGAIGVVATIIGIRQQRTGGTHQRVVRDIENWFCGCGRNNHRVEVSEVSSATAQLVAP